MSTAQQFANECREDYFYYWNKAKSLRVSGGMYKLYVRLAWQQRCYLRKWIALA